LDLARNQELRVRALFNGSDPGSLRCHIAPLIVTRHAEDASFLWSTRDAVLNHNRHTFAERMRFDGRLAAHLDGLRAAGDRGYDVCLKEHLDWHWANTVFVTAFLAFEHDYDARFALLFEGALWGSENRRAVIAASAFQDSEYCRQCLLRWSETSDVTLQHVGLAGLVAQRQATQALVAARLASDDVTVRACATLAVGKLGLSALSTVLWDLVRDPASEVQVECALSLARLKETGPAITDVLMTASESSNSKHQEDAIVALARLHPRRGRALFDRWANKQETRRLAILVAEVLGEASLVQELVSFMSDAVLARRAGEALQTITDLDLELLDLTGPPLPQEAAAADEDAIPAADSDRNLAWPDPTLVARELAKLALQNGTRYLAGKAIGSVDDPPARASRTALVEIVQQGRGRQRKLAALELGQHGATLPLVEPRAPATRSHALPGLAAWLSTNV
jgi:uncharacterized protein (TIGR02270 family)